jgi:AcrR family transcriptional regulator
MTRHRTHEERRDQILAAARDCFAERGFAETRVEDIARRASLSKGGVYVHFASKDAIFDALHEAEVRGASEALAAVRSLELPATEKLAALAAGMLARYASSEEHRKFLLVLGEVGLRLPSVQARIAATHEVFVDAIAALIEEGVARGELRAVPPRHTAQLLKILSDGIEGAIALGHPLDMESLVATSVDVLLKGLRPPSVSSPPHASPSP